jgi:HSP20 family protein
LHFAYITPQFEFRPSLDVYEATSEFILLLELSGMNEETIRIEVENQHLSISGKRTPPVTPPVTIHRMEIAFGEFNLAFEIPDEIDIHHIHANYENGFLLIHLPKLTNTNIPIKEG